MTGAPIRKSLVVAGAALFLLGLLQGAVVQSFVNPRMALSAHLTAVQCGMALMIAGIVWSSVNLKDLLAKLAHWSVIGGMYGLWIGLTLSAATGASNTLPIAGAGHNAQPFVELVVSSIVLGSSAIMTVGWALLVVGLISHRAGNQEGDPGAR